MPERSHHHVPRAVLSATASTRGVSVDRSGKVRRFGVRPIVVGYDGTPASDAAARWAAGAAQRLGRGMRMVQVIPWPALRGSGSAAVALGADALGRAAERLLDKACRDIRRRHPEVEIDAEVLIGDPVPVLLREAAGGSLLVLGSRGLGELREVAVGSVMAHIATHATSPVIVVPADWRPQPDRPRQVVVGVDGSVESWNAIAFGFEFAEQTGAAVTAVLAWHDPTSTGPGDMLFPVHDLDVLAEDSAVVLSEAVAGQAVDHPDVKVTEKLVHGTPAKALEEASREADLLVVGSRGRGRIRGFLLGSVSRAVLHHATCPVAVVR
ncbi:universal stress protein [Kribbella speibonae]|uniref:Universal stress protein n=1 Tax=Kribbella speibonae TaxID=1572660 RepID=A0A4R0ICE8_9ACTN|nr:universal stress protein [Kribbella speibonae]